MSLRFGKMFTAILVAGAITIGHVPVTQTAYSLTGDTGFLSSGTAEAKSRSSSRSSSSSWGRSKPRSTPRVAKPTTTTRPKATVTTRSSTTIASRPKAITTTRPSTTTATRPKAATPRVATTASGRPQLKRTTAYQTQIARENAAAATRRKPVITAARSTSSYKAMTGKRTYTSESVTTRRTSYYTSTRRTQYDRYSGNDWGSRSYGGYDPSFMMIMAMSDDPLSASMMYGMGVNPWFAIWMTQAKDSGNSEEKARLAQLEAEMAQMKAQGVAPQPVETTLAAMNIPAEVAFTEEVLTGVADVTPDISFSTGGVDGVYSAFCAGNGSEVFGYKNFAGDTLNVSCSPSKGSTENITAVLRGTSTCGIVQSDVMDAHLRNNASATFGPYQIPLYNEPFLMIVNEDSKIYDVQDFYKQEPTVLLGGSGAAASWKSLSEYDATQNYFSRYNYGALDTQVVDRNKGVAEVAADKDKVMLVVMGLGADFIKNLNDQYGDKVRLVAFNDGNFDELEDREGNSIYDWVELDASMYPKLLKKDIDTVAVQAVMVCNQREIEKFGPTAGQTIADVAHLTIPEVQSFSAGLQ